MIDYQGTLQPLVTKAARSTSSNFPSYIDPDDVEQALWVWAYEKRNTVEPLILKGGSWERQIYSTMTKVANSHLHKEEAAVNGYSQDDTFTYTTQVVETLLDTIFSYEDWQSFGNHGDGQPKAKGQANMTGDMVAMLIDVKSAVERLTEKQYNAIVWKYKYQWTFEAIAMETGLTVPGARDRVLRGVEAVRRALGRENLADLRQNRDTRREALSGAEAEARTRRDYEG